VTEPSIFMLLKKGMKDSIFHFDVFGKNFKPSLFGIGVELSV
jgi:hypothetical protein